MEALWALDFESRKDQEIVSLKHEIVSLKHQIRMYEEQNVCEIQDMEVGVGVRVGVGAGVEVDVCKIQDMDLVTASVENMIDERQMLVTASVENTIDASLNNRHQTDSQQKGLVVEDWAGVVAALKLELEDQKLVALALQEKKS